MSKFLAICLTYLYSGYTHDCVTKTRLHNIKCLEDGTPPTSEESSLHSKCVTVSTTYCNT